MILIAGGEGFIGKNLERLFQSHDIAYEVADLKSGTDVCDVKQQYDVIVLLAANLNHDMQMFQDNLAIYRWAMRQSAHIIYTSSAAVYADSLEPQKEDDATPAPTIYGRSKLLGEQLIKKVSDRYTILRLANVYGDGDGNGAIDIFKRGGKKIFGDGSDIRDYVSVKVVCNAIKDIALNPEKYNGETFNISSNEPMTTKAAWYSYFKYDGDFGQKPEYVPPRGFDVKHSVLNNKKAVEAGLIYAD